MLLDIYRLAEKLSDQYWMEETSRRLSQLTFQMAENEDYKKLCENNENFSRNVGFFTHFLLR